MFSVALSRGYPHWVLPSTLLYGARTFLGRFSSLPRLPDLPSLDNYNRIRVVNISEARVSALLLRSRGTWVMQKEEKLPMRSLTRE